MNSPVNAFIFINSRRMELHRVVFKKSETRMIKECNATYFDFILEKGLDILNAKYKGWEIMKFESEVIAQAIWNAYSKEYDKVNPLK